MGFCERIKTERVLYDQRVFVQDVESRVSLELPAGFTLTRAANPSITADILDCDVGFGESPPTVALKAHFILKFTGTISNRTTTTDREFEFSFLRSLDPVSLVKLDAGSLTPDEIRRAFCQVFEVQVIGQPTLAFTKTSFDVLVDLAVMVKIVVFDQITVSLCPPNNRIAISGGEIVIIPPGAD